MLRFARAWIVLPLVAILLTAVTGHSLGDKPVQIGDVVVTEGDRPDDFPAAQNRSSAQVQEKIRQALEGEFDDKNSGSGVLNDVLDVIKERGSILDGSSLDDRSALPKNSADSASRKALVAEQLLKASRLLQSLSDLDENRRALIGQMRREAKKLLSE